MPSPSRVNLWRVDYLLPGIYLSALVLFYKLIGTDLRTLSPTYRTA